MPFAGYKNFSACLADQKKKGKSDLASHKICGYLKNKTEGKTMTDESLKQVESEILTEIWAQEILGNFSEKD